MRRLKRFKTVNSIVAILLLFTFALLSYDRFHAAGIKENSANLERCIRTFGELLSHKGEGFNIVDGKLLAGSYVINGNFEVPDKIREIFGGTATVFMGDRRISTNVLRDDGKRAVGTKLEGPAYDAVFKQGKPFRGEAKILGIPYFTAYDPIRNKKGEIIGALYVGLKKSEFLAYHALVKTQMILILLGLLTVFIVFMVLSSRLVKKAEGQIEADHLFLQTLIDAIPIPVFYKDVHGRYLGGNKSFESYNGLPTSELIGKNVFDLLSPDLADHVYKCEQDLLRKQGLLVEETAMPHADGSLREVMYLKTTFPAADGSIGGLIGTMLDISDRKRAEEGLRESQQHLSDIIQFYPDATLVIDNEGKVTAWNRAMEELTGVKAEDMLGKGDYEYALPFYGERRPLLINLAMQSEEEIEKKYAVITHRGNTIFGETYIQNAHGEKLYFQGTAAALYNSSGEIIAAIESLRNISERKQMEDHLRTLSCGIEQSPVTIVITDREGTIEYTNPKFTQLTGYTSTEAIGQNPRILKSGLTPPDIYRQLWDTILSGKEWHGEWCDKKKNGELYWEAASISPIVDAKGEIYRFIAVKEDITGRKQAEEEIHRLNTELEAKVEEKTRQLLAAQEDLVRKEKLSILGQLSGSVGHELRNPLGVMSNAVYFLKMVHAEGDDTTREYLDIIKHEIDNSQRIITDLLDFARTKTPQTKPVPVSKLLDGSIAACVIPGNVSLQTEIPDSLPLLKIDPLQMEQVFQNLITNAIQAMPNGGALRISACLASDNFVALSIKDTGEGISPQNMKKLFQPLFTTKAKGIGLGLVVCKNLVEANGGRILVESRLNEGTTFTALLPVKQEEA